MINDLNKTKFYEVVKRGYYLDTDNEILFNKNKRPVVLTIGTTGYKYFKIKINNKPREIKIHRLVAFLNFGDRIFNKKLQVRHLDNNKLNNKNNNIKLGTASENMHDIPEEERIEHSIHSGSFIRKFSDKTVKEIREMRASGATYKDIYNKFGVVKSTAHYIINNAYY
jgi:hypothetical protein